MGTVNYFYGTGQMKDRDEITVYVEGIGELKNPVKAG